MMLIKIYENLKNFRVHLMIFIKKKKQYEMCLSYNGFYRGKNEKHGCVLIVFEGKSCKNFSNKYKKIIIM